MVDDDTFTNELASMVINWSRYSSYFCVRERADIALQELRDLYKSNSDKFPDYILLDLKMPELHGFDFIREFETSFPEKKNKTHFIVTTSSILTKDKKEAFSFDSVIDYIVKPIPGNYIENLIAHGFVQEKEMKNYNQ